MLTSDRAYLWPCTCRSLCTAAHSRLRRSWPLTARLRRANGAPSARHWERVLSPRRHKTLQLSTAAQVCNQGLNNGRRVNEQPVLVLTSDRAYTCPCCYQSLAFARLSAHSRYRASNRRRVLNRKRLQMERKFIPAEWTSEGRASTTPPLSNGAAFCVVDRHGI